MVPSRALNVHHNATVVTVGFSRGLEVVAQHTMPHREASKELIPCIDTLLQQVACPLAELDYISCNTGPAPFTTLRTVVVTVNGLGFATGVPLVPVNGIVQLAIEAHGAEYKRTYAVMNAFGSDVYYAVWDPEQRYLDTGVIALEGMAALLDAYHHQHFPASVQLVGDKARQVAGLVPELGPALSFRPLMTHASFEAIVREGHRLWASQETVAELVPYYGKNVSTYIPRSPFLRY